MLFALLLLQNSLFLHEFTAQVEIRLGVETYFSEGQIFPFVAIAMNKLMDM
jgi:hypothetical protein